jgi:hypothetical protein
MSNVTWPFDQARNVMAITTRRVIEEGHPIVHVTHFSEDHSWAFVDGAPFEMSSALMVLMGRVIDKDPSLLEIADLPPGWVATRQAVGDPWRRSANHEV